MDDNTIENSGIRNLTKTSSRTRDSHKKSRDRKTRKRASSSRSRSSRSSSSSRSRERSSKKKRDSRKKKSSKYSESSSSSSSRSRSSSRSSSSRSRSASYGREKIKRKYQFEDRHSDNQPYHSNQHFTDNRSSSNNNFNQQSGGALRVSDLILGRAGSYGGPHHNPSFGNRPKFETGPNENRHAKKLYFGNLPQNINEADFIEYIYRSLELAGGVLQPGNPITAIKYEHEKNYIFLDFRSVEETSTCLQLDGISYQGKILRIKRPKQYDNFPKPEPTRPIPNLDLTKLGTRCVSPKVDNSSTKVFVGGIPHNMDESAIIEILMRAGPLKSFHLVKDRAGVSKGFGFCEYHTEQDVAKCIETLNGLQMGHQRILQVKRAFNLSERDFLGPSSNAASNLARNFLDMFNSASNPQAAAFQQQPPLGQYGNYQNNDNTYNNNNPNIIAEPQPVPTPVVEEKATNVICISNMVDPNEAEDDAEFEDIYEDIKNEVIRFGQVRSILIPRKKDGYDGSCLGKVYIEYEDAKSAISAKSVLKTYKFGGHTLDPIYYEPNQFMERVLL